MIKFLTFKFTPIAWLIVPWIYSAIMESSAKQATLGKMALGIVVTDLEGKRISFIKATGRHFCKIISILSLFIGFFMAGFTKQKQALHDKLANCLLLLRESNVITQLAQQMNTIHNLDELLHRMLDAIMQMMGAKRGFVMFRNAFPEERGSGELILKVSHNISREKIASDEFEFSRGVISEVEHIGKPQVITNARTDERFTSKTAIIDLDFSSILCAPIKVEEQLMGLIYIDNHLVRKFFTEHDLELIVTFIAQTANAIETATLRERGLEHQRLEQEMEDAREMQLSLLPKNSPQIEGFDIAGVCEPATEVGGDYFTYIWMDKEKTKLGIILIDVTGHGMKAATTTFLASGMLQSEIKNSSSPGEIMSNMHYSLQEILSKNAFIAMSFALIDTNQKSLTHFNAGLPTPILIRDGRFAELDIQSDVPLGCHLPANYVGTSVPLLPGDVLLFHSDGLSEAENFQENMYAYTKMEPLLNSLATQPQNAQAWLDALTTDVRTFTESREPEDDLTVVVVRVLS
jgi:serine phosphatase RsbU (regulator of sigma subunit)